MCHANQVIGIDIGKTVFHLVAMDEHGYALGGLPGSRLLASLGIAASRDTVPRRLKGALRPARNRKCARSVSILMDLEQNAVIDLLPDRSTKSFTDWLQRHPGVEIIARDRCGLMRQELYQELHVLPHPR
jgi:hypothetical protein